MDYEVSEAGLPILDQFSGDTLVDCFFEIASRIDGAESYELQLRASHKGSLVGMKVTVRSGIKGVLDADKKPIAANVYRQGVRFSRTGPESDRLVAAIAELYGLPEAPPKMVGTVAFSVIALHRAGHVDMEKQPIKLELFGPDGTGVPAELYAEWFLELDLTNGFAYWTEKDPKYRAATITRLTQALPSSV